MEVVDHVPVINLDHVPVINLCNGVTVSEVPLDVVAEGLVGLLGHAGQIPSSFETRADYLVVLDEGGAEVLPAIDGAGWKSLQPVVVVAVSCMYRDGVGAQPRLGVGLTVEPLETNGLEGRGPLDG